MSESKKKCPFMTIQIMAKNTISGQTMPTILPADCMENVCAVYNEIKKQCGHIMNSEVK